MHSEAGLSVRCPAGARLAVEVRLAAKRVLLENLRKAEEMLAEATSTIQGCLAHKETPSPLGPP